MIRCGLTTNLQDHYHFYDCDKDELIDIDKNEISFSKSPEIPSGKIKDSSNIIINLKIKFKILYFLIEYNFTKC